MQIRNAVIPVAGQGTGLLPSTKSQPKEMLPVGRKPVVQYVVEEFELADLTRILFVTGRNKNSIENHFDPDLELIRGLKAAGKHERLEDQTILLTAKPKELQTFIIKHLDTEGAFGEFTDMQPIRSADEEKPSNAMNQTSKAARIF